MYINICGRTETNIRIVRVFAQLGWYLNTKKYSDNLYQKNILLNQLHCISICIVNGVFKLFEYLFALPYKLYIQTLNLIFFSALILAMPDGFISILSNT